MIVISLTLDHTTKFPTSPPSSLLFSSSSPLKPRSCSSFPLLILPAVSAGRSRGSCPWRWACWCAGRAAGSCWSAPWSGPPRWARPGACPRTRSCGWASSRTLWGWSARAAPGSRGSELSGCTWGGTQRSRRETSSSAADESVSQSYWLGDYFWYVRLYRTADVRRSHPFLPQSDGQVLGPVGLHQRHFTGGLVGQLHLEGPHVYRGRLGLGLKLLLKSSHVQLLRKGERKRIFWLVAAEKWNGNTWQNWAVVNVNVLHLLLTSKPLLIKASVVWMTLGKL